MAIGSVLLQPDRIRGAAQPPAVVLEDAIALFVRVAVDRAQGGTVLDDLLAGLESSFQSLLDQKKAGLDAARQHLADWLAPVIAKLGSIGGMNDSTAEEIFAAGGTIVGLLAQLAQSLPANQVRDHIDRLLGILSNDLGLTSEALDALVSGLFDAMAARVRQAPASASAATRDNRAQIALLLRRLRRQLPAQVPFPALNADTLAGPLLDRMRQGGYDNFARGAAAIGGAVSGGFTICGALADVVPFSRGVGGGAVGAAASDTHYMNPIAWYASWLTGDEVHEGDDAANLTNVSFGPIRKEDKEGVARHSRWVQYALEGLITLIVWFRKGNYANGTLQALWTATLGVVSGTNDWDIPWWLNAPESALFVVLGALEGRSQFGDHDGLLYPWHITVKGLRKFWMAHAFRTARSSLLSALTLLNNRTDDTSQPARAQRINRSEFIGLSILFTELWALIFAAVIPHSWYSVNFDQKTHPGAGALVGLYLTFSLTSMLLGLLFGFLAGWAFSGEQGEIKPRADWVYFLAPLATFNIYWYFLNEGRTDGGKRGYNFPGPTNSISDLNELTFTGYQDPSTSPYNLPFESGKSAECIQGNHGLFSHNAILPTVQNFAYDFSLDYNTEILCMRDGVIVVTGGPFTFDGIPDGTEDDSKSASGANMVTVMHTSIDATHDVDADGTAKITHATYLHGASGTIPGRFKVHGTAVKKGEVIMHVNSTGVSRLNHVHVDIRPDNGSGALASGGNPPVPGMPKNYTMPFVFNEVGGDGVPKSNYYYESKNNKVA